MSADHKLAGKVDLLELGIYAFLGMKADSAGVVITSATSIAAQCKQVSVRTAQRKLRQLEQLGWIRTTKAPGTNGLYRVQICGSPVGAFVGAPVGDADAISDEATTHSHNPTCDLVGAPDGDADGDAPASQPVASCPQQEADHDRQWLSTPGNPLEELGVVNLPDRHRDFVELCEANPRADGESLVAWTKRISAACDSKNVFLPRHFFACARHAVRHVAA